MSTRCSRATRGSRSAKRSPNSRASSTGNSTSPRSSPAADSICNWVTRHGCGRGRTWTPCSRRATPGGSWPSNQARLPARLSGKRHWRSRESAISSSSATTDVDRHGRVPRFRAGISAACRAAARPLPMLHGADMESCISARESLLSSILKRISLTRRPACFASIHTLRLRRHWQFINELKLYEIGDQHRYGVHVYGQTAGYSQFPNGIVTISSRHC